MASEGRAEALADDQNKGALDPKDECARAIHDGPDSGPYTRPWDSTFGPCPELVHLKREVRRRLGAATRCESFNWQQLATKLKTLPPYAKLLPAAEVPEGAAASSSEVSLRSVCFLNVL